MRCHPGPNIDDIPLDGGDIAHSSEGTFALSKIKKFVERKCFDGLFNSTAFPRLVEIAKENNCASVDFDTARPGWERLLRTVGFKRLPFYRLYLDLGDVHA